MGLMSWPFFSFPFCFLESSQIIYCLSPISMLQLPLRRGMQLLTLKHCARFFNRKSEVRHHSLKSFRSVWCSERLHAKISKIHSLLSSDNSRLPHFTLRSSMRLAFLLVWRVKKRHPFPANAGSRLPGLSFTDRRIHFSHVLNSRVIFALLLESLLCLLTVNLYIWISHTLYSKDF